MSRRVLTLMWIGIAAPPLAWMAEHGMGFSISEANCSIVGPQWGVAFSTWVIVVTVATGLIATVGVVASAVAYREVKGTEKDAAPPSGRVWLLSIFGLITGPILIAMIVLSGLGALLLDSCTQS